MPLNTALKLAFFQSKRTQIEVATELARDIEGMNEPRLSKIVNGHIDPTPEEKKAIAKALHRKPSELFAEVTA